MAALSFVENKYHQAKSWYSFLRFVQNPSSTEKIFDMAQSFRKSSPQETIDRVIASTYAIPEFQKAYDDKYFPTMPSLEELEHMPAGSLGRSFYEFIQKWNLDIDLFPEQDSSSKSQYFLTRAYQCHDVWHVLTGYDTNLEDELALQAFGIGQNSQALSLLLISGGLVHLLNKHPERSQEFLTAITRGFERGQAAKNLFIHPVIERMRDPLEDVRRDLNII